MRVQLSKSHHPDIPHHKLEPAFHKIADAYSVLHDPLARRTYDVTLSLQHNARPTHHTHYPASGGAFEFFGAATCQVPSSVRPLWRAHSTRPPPPSTPTSAYTPIPGTGDRHHRHPGQRYIPPDPAAQHATWKAQQDELHCRMSSPWLIGGVRGVILTVGTVAGLGWILGGL
ncbi:hypothetical protein DFH07DRAFT_770936 [Mycena maculata]|uniref:J domain-containing protein n=1 Tax=Mycena maculata TaxID=230809 RepID=A0AAD7JH28_9AGAR|nr:hypothetical protein DFH07DRAFT_770936 [Mycena maculata]